MGGKNKTPPGALRLPHHPLLPTLKKAREVIPMGVSVDIKFDYRDAIRTLENAVDVRTYEKATMAGMKYGAKAGKTRMAKEITARYSLKSARVKQAISDPILIDGGREAVLKVSRKSPTATTYGFKDNGRRVSGSFIKGRRVTISRGFAMVGGQGAGLIYRRLRSTQYPIDVVHGPSVGSIAIGKGAFSEQIQRETHKRVAEQWVVGVERSLRGSFKRGAKLFT